VRERTDEKTGRTVRQLTDAPDGASVGYFRQCKYLPDGRLIGHTHGRPHSYLGLDPESGQVETLQFPGHVLRLTCSSGRAYCFDHKTRQVLAVERPGCAPVRLGELPEGDLKPTEIDITEDGRTVVIAERVQPPEDVNPPPGRDAAKLLAWMARPRSGNMWSYDLKEGKLTHVLHLSDRCPIHIDPSPADPRLVKFSHDMYDAFCQRIWTVRVDGSALTPIRPQERGELVTHEFWWPGGQLIGYKYQDRRNDPTIEQLPWGEYSPIPTQLGLAGLDGRERYLSDPLNHYHSHVFVSRDCKWLCGEGTDSRSFVYVAPFSMDSTRVDFVPLVSIHTPYIAFSPGQHVNAGFSADARWLVYNDTMDGKLQVCAVRVEL